MEVNISPARLEDVLRDMRPLDAQALIRPNGAMLAEEVATILGAEVAAISRMVRVSHSGERGTREAQGACPFTPGD
eukprot:7996439-Alexandrium_andersonii.AAC.1